MYNNLYKEITENKKIIILISGIMILLSGYMHLVDFIYQIGSSIGRSFISG